MSDRSPWHMPLTMLLGAVLGWILWLAIDGPWRGSGRVQELREEIQQNEAAQDSLRARLVDLEEIRAQIVQQADSLYQVSQQAISRANYYQGQAAYYQNQRNELQAQISALSYSELDSIWDLRIRSRATGQ